MMRSMRPIPALLGCQIAFMFEKETGKPSFMVNSPATDEMRQIARLTGIKVYTGSATVMP